MKKWLMIVVVMCAGMMQAQDPAYVHEDILHVRYGGNYVMDGYLSPYRFSGWQIGLGNEWWQPFHRQPKADNRYWQHVGQVEASYSRLMNSVKQNLIQGVQAEAGWGALHTWQLTHGAAPGIDGGRLAWMMGPYIGADVMGKFLSKNTNKPFSLDLGMDAQLMAGLEYQFQYKKTAYRVRYLGRINAIGIMWQPDYWQSYFEAYEGAGLQESIRFSYVGNRQFIHQEISMDMQFLRSTWRIGLQHEYLRYGTHDLPFRRQEISLVVGTCFGFTTRPKIIFY